MANITPSTQRKIITQMAGKAHDRCLSVRDVSAIMCDHTGGTDAAGVWDWREALDLMQAGTIDASLKVLKSVQGRDAGAQLAQLIDICASLPTETRRSERQVQLQQFSTPVPYGFVAVQAAGLTCNDTVLEPSAGTGVLARLAGQTGAGVHANEIDPFRLSLLKRSLGAGVTAHDGEFIDDLLNAQSAASVVLMNPPFSSSSARSGDPSIALRHCFSAAKRLRDGGRLVAIVPASATAKRQPVLWKRFVGQVTPVLRLIIPGSVYYKLGTSVETHLLIADKGAAPCECGALRVGSLDEALRVIADRLPARGPLKDVSPVGGASARPKPRSLQEGTAPRRSLLVGRTGPISEQGATVSLVPEVFDAVRMGEAVSDVYARYAPQRFAIAGAKEHPTMLVESLAMGSVAPPAPAPTPLKLPSRLVQSGALSEAQIETLIMAETAYASDLPGRFVSDETGALIRRDDAPLGANLRQGYFLGDGTGCGKGRQVAGLIMAGWLVGRRRAVWVSKSATLLEDARRDWGDLGGAPLDIQPMSRWKADDPITLSNGIVFVTYATLRAVSKTGSTRLGQLLDWLGADFDGVIAFDEAHAMQNAGGGMSNRGVQKPSQQGLAGLRLQNAVPQARILYVSATGATEVSNLAYASRLGLWGAGEGYPFTSREQFVTAMEAGGVAAMEVVARDLKAMGLYTARALSFEGVEYDVLEHRLSADQITIYDTWAQAFKVIHQNLHAALEATGVTANTANTGGAEAGSGSARAAAISAFESCKQRFFGHLLQGMKAPAVIRAIREDVAEGWAPVVQIVSTGEALLKRRLEELAPDEDLLEAMLTPREYVVGYLKNAFPIWQMHLIEQEDGSNIAQPLLDETGNRVVSREALALRDEALEDLMLLAPIPSALDQLVWAFGGDAVAEVTGRSQRPVKDGSSRMVVERRSASSNTAETTAFMNGEKDILIFSDAGGTGRSYQAAKSAKNQKRRRHYLMEPGWRADNAIQGLGRTHRAAQVSAPFFRVCTTDVHGEKRFTSTIARRLDTLGALTKGQRETASQGMFRAEDNLESSIARGCLRALYRDIVTDPDAPIPLDSFTTWTGLRLTGSDGSLLDELPPIQRFLNRILALPIEMQNLIFSEFMERIAIATARAQAAGTLDMGLEHLRGDSINAHDPETLRIDDSNGAVTSLIPLSIQTRTTYPSASEVLSIYTTCETMQNRISGNVALIAPCPRYAIEGDGEMVHERRVIRPKGETWTEEGAFGTSHWEACTRSVFVEAWAAEVSTLPEVTERKVYLLTGLILPIWRTIPGQQTRIYRATTDDGTTYLGRALDAYGAGQLRARYIKTDVSDPDAVLRAVREGGQQVDLGGGLSVVQRRVAGHLRLEIIGADKETLRWLRNLGCFTEIHQYTLRVFIPEGDGAEPLKVVKALCDQGPPVQQVA